MPIEVCNYICFNGELKIPALHYAKRGLPLCNKLIYLFIFAQESFNVTVRLNTNFSGVDSLSTLK